MATWQDTYSQALQDRDERERASCSRIDGEYLAACTLHRLPLDLLLTPASRYKPPRSQCALERSSRCSKQWDIICCFSSTGIQSSKRQARDGDRYISERQAITSRPRRECTSEHATLSTSQDGRDLGGQAAQQSTGRWEDVGVADAPERYAGAEDEGQDRGAERQDERLRCE